MDISTLAQEAKKFGIENLKNITGISKSNIYGILKGEINPTVPTMEKLLKPLGFELKIIKKRGSAPSKVPSLDDLDYLRWALADRGAPISAEKNVAYKRPEINKLLLNVLEQGRYNADINTILTIFIYKNFSKFNWTEIFKSTLELSYLGYHLQLIYDFTQELKYAELLLLLDKKTTNKGRPERLIRGKKTGHFEKKRLSKTDNKIAKKWKFRTLDNLADLECRFIKWA